MTPTTCPWHRSAFADDGLERRIRDLMAGDGVQPDAQEAADHVFWRCERMGRTRSLATYLEGLSESRILELVGIFGDDGREHAGETLARRALSALTAGPDRLMAFVYPYGPDRVRQVRDLLRAGRARRISRDLLASPAAYAHEAYSMPPVVLLFDSGDGLEQVMPDEVGEVLSTLAGRDWRAYERHAVEWRRFLDRLEASVDLRGVVPFADAVRECELIMGMTFDDDLLMHYLVDGPWAEAVDVTVDLFADDVFLVLSDLYELFGDGAEDRLFMEEFCLDLADAQSAYAAHDVTDEILAAGGVHRYLLGTDEALALMQFLDEHVPEGFDDATFAIELTNVLIMLLRSNDGAHMVDEALLSMGLKATGDLKARLHELAGRLDRIVPKWHLNGWCGRELEELGGTAKPQLTLLEGGSPDEGGYLLVEDNLGPRQASVGEEGAEGDHSADSYGIVPAVLSPSATDAGFSAVPDADADEWDVVAELVRWNDVYLREFENWLFESGYSHADVGRQVSDVSTFLNFFCAEREGITMEEGADEVGTYLGNIFIRRVMWSTPESVRTTAESIKEFYRCMYAYGNIEKHMVDQLIHVIADNVDAWCLRCAQYNDPDSESPFDLPDLI